jgi:hypothetical protein
VTDLELATRLSYFLWSSAPDDALLDLAADNKLTADPAALEAQVRRMLADPRGRALTDQFAVQWLQLSKIADARPSTEFFPTFKQPLRQAMSDEVTSFFDGLRTGDRPVLDLLDADYTYVNADLARHYGLEGVSGTQLRKVALPKDLNRGGILGFAGVLAMTSHTSRTSPTLRGKYVLEVLFGTPPNPPPPDAGQINDRQQKGKEPKSFRELLAQHASNATCAACHRKIDPLGFGLDNFDAIGHWRVDAGAGRPLDTSGQLPTGEKFSGAAEFRKIILARKGEFVRNMTGQMLAYAIGRQLGYDDDAAVNETVARLEHDNHKFSAMVLGIVNSHPFRYRRTADATADAASKKE